jgi:hypothetical protein
MDNYDDLIDSDIDIDTIIKIIEQKYNHKSYINNLINQNSTIRKKIIKTLLNKSPRKDIKLLEKESGVTEKDFESERNIYKSKWDVTNKIFGIMCKYVSDNDIKLLEDELQEMTYLSLVNKYDKIKNYLENKLENKEECFYEK